MSEQNQAERLAATHEIVHPEYGPCDALNDGECYECAKQVTSLRSRLETAEVYQQWVQRLARGGER